MIQARLELLSRELFKNQDTPNISLDVLLDTFLALFLDCKAASKQTEHIASFVGKCS